jgi:hypothetical protein
MVCCNYKFNIPFAEARGSSQCNILMIITKILVIGLNILPIMYSIYNKETLIIVYDVFALLLCPVSYLYLSNIFKNHETGNFYDTVTDRLSVILFPLFLLTKIGIGFILLIKGMFIIAPNTTPILISMISYITILELIMCIDPLMVTTFTCRLLTIGPITKHPVGVKHATVFILPLLLFIIICAIIGLMKLSINVYRFDVIIFFTIENLIQYIILMHTLIAFIFDKNKYFFNFNKWYWINVFSLLINTIIYFAAICLSSNIQKFIENFFNFAFTGVKLECYNYEGNIEMCIYAYTFTVLPLIIIVIIIIYGLTNLICYHTRGKKKLTDLINDNHQQDLERGLMTQPTLLSDTFACDDMIVHDNSSNHSNHVIVEIERGIWIPLLRTHPTIQSKTFAMSEQKIDNISSA